MRFAITGAAGYIAPRHLKAIKESGNQLTLAFDPEPAANGSLIDYFPGTHYTNSSADFDERLRSYADRAEGKIDYVSVCSPTEFHAAQIQAALKCGAHVVCEKPLR